MRLGHCPNVTVRIKGLGKTLTLRDILNITAYWAKTNKRRTVLIDKHISGEISDAEEKELKHLQKLTGYRRQLTTPLPTAKKLKGRVVR